jgi:hypothetical protein
MRYVMLLIYHDFCENQALDFIKTFDKLGDVKKRISRQQIEKEYDELYERAAKIISETNPCEVKTVNGFVRCMSCSHRVCGEVILVNELCCDGCKHHNMKKGCQAEKPLQCKLWLCEQSKRKHPNVNTQLRLLHIEAMEKFGCLLNRGDKTESITHINTMNFPALYRETVNA